MRIILTGSSGLIGSRFEELMFENHEIIPLSTKDANLSDKNSVNNFFENKISGEIDFLIHFAGKTDVDGCEKDKIEDKNLIENLQIDLNDIENIELNNSDWSDKSTAFAINFIGTKNLYEEARRRNIKFIYISTDFIFNDNDIHNEESNPNPINWYGMTKWFGERLIDKNKDLIVRLSFPYGYPSPVKQDFVQKLISLLREKDEVSLIEDQTITPTFIDDIVLGLDFLMQKNASGIYHLTGSSQENPYEIGQKIRNEFGFTTQINSTTRENLYAERALRPFRSIMSNEKIVSSGFIPKIFDEGLALISGK